MEKENIELKKNAEASQVQRKSEKDRNGMIGGFVFGVIFMFATYKIYCSFSKIPIAMLLVYIGALCAFVCLAVSFSCYFDYKESKKIEMLEEESRKEEKELIEIAPEKRALRAEKLFRMNQKELMRYYDMNLAQTKFLMGLGISMILFGMMIVLITLYMYSVFDADKVLLCVGSLSGVIGDFIGAIFIKMYTENIEAAIKFHSRFAESNNLLLANSIANKIENDEIREETLAEISKSITRTGGSLKD